LVAGVRKRLCSGASAFPTSDTMVITCHKATEVTALLVPSVDLSLDFSEQNMWQPVQEKRCRKVAHRRYPLGKPMQKQGGKIIQPLHVS